MRMRYRTQLQQMADREDRYHNIREGAWRQGRALAGLDIDTRGNLGSKGSQTTERLPEGVLQLCRRSRPMAEQNGRLNLQHKSRSF